MSEYDIIQLQSEVADIRTRLSRLEREQGAAGGEPRGTWSPHPTIAGAMRYSGDFAGLPAENVDRVLGSPELSRHERPAPTPPADKAGPAPGYRVYRSEGRWCAQADLHTWAWRGNRGSTEAEANAATWKHAKAAAAEAAHAHAAQQPATSGRGEATVPDRAALKGAYCQACGLRLQGVYVGINGERVRCDDTEACDERAATPPRTRSALTVAADAVREAWNTEGDTHAAQALRRIENELRALEAAKGGE